MTLLSCPPPPTLSLPWSGTVWLLLTLCSPSAQQGFSWLLLCRREYFSPRRSWKTKMFYFSSESLQASHHDQLLFLLTFGTCSHAGRLWARSWGIPRCRKAGRRGEKAGSSALKDSLCLALRAKARVVLPASAPVQITPLVDACNGRRRLSALGLCPHVMGFSKCCETSEK